MKRKKTPAPRRAGNGTDLDREFDRMVAALKKLRTADRVAYRAFMRLAVQVEKKST